MAFLNPLVLFALAAAAIPILIHLFNFRKPRRVDFSSLQFLRELEKKAMRKMRIRQWLLLALRTLAIAFLVLAFARPTVETAWASVFGGRVETATALVIDNSRSMTVRDAQGDLFSQATDLADAIAESRRPGDELFLLSTIGGPVQPGAFRQPPLALDAIAGMEPRAGVPRLGATLDRAFHLLDGAGPQNREVLLISNLQASTFADSVAAPAPPDVRITLLPLGDRRQANTAVVDARVVSRVVEAGRPADVEATLVHYGNDPARGVQASLYLEGERVAQASVDLQPGIPQPVRFTAVPRHRGWLAGEVRLDPDNFEFDDRRFVAMHVPESRRVLLVQGEGQRADFLRLALTLGEEAATDGARFSVQVVPQNQLSGQVLDEFDVISLLGPSSLASGEQASLARFVGDGGGLLVFPSDRSNDALSELLTRLQGGRYGAMIGIVGGDEVVARFGRAALDHPLFEGMLDDSGRSLRLESPDLTAVSPLAPSAGQTVIELSGGQPFLHEVRYGSGSVLVFSAAPDPRWGDFPTRGLFVPLMHRAVTLLSADGSPDQSLIAGEGGSLRVQGVAEGLRLSGPDGLELVPEQRQVPGGVVLDIPPDLVEAGIYDLMQGDRIVRRIALNPDPEESDLTPISPAEAVRHLEALTGAEVRLLDASGGRGLEAAHRATDDRAGVELWNVFLLLALLCLVAEMLVAMRWKPEAIPA